MPCTKPCSHTSRWSAWAYSRACSLQWRFGNSLRRGGHKRLDATGAGPNNLGVLAVDALLVRVLLPITAVGLALVAEAHGFGLFNIIALPTWASIVLSVILLDLA